MRNILASAIGLLIVAAVVATMVGCAPGPRGRPVAGPMNQPVPMSSVAGSGSVEWVRQQLLGTWELAALELAPAGGATRVPVDASGTLTYDQFGNLTIEAHTTDAAAPVAAREVNRLSFKGRAVIDVVKSELRLMNLTGNADPGEVLAPERRRLFEVDANVLRLSSLDERGEVTAIATWHRRS